MQYFPIFLELGSTRKILVYGGGEEALRKVRLLARTEARIGIVADTLHPELHELHEAGRIEWLAEDFSSDQLHDAACVVAACSDEAAGTISRAASARNIPVNVVDRADLSTFIVPAIVDRDPLVIAIGTEGAGPVLAQGIRAHLESLLAPDTGQLLERARALRDKVAQLVPKGAARRSFWQSFFFGPIRDAFLAGDETRYNRELTRNLANGSAHTTGRVVVMTCPHEVELLTLEAHRLLQQADIIIHDEIACADVLNYARRDAIREHSELNEWLSSPARYSALARKIANYAVGGDLVIRLVADQGYTAQSELHLISSAVGDDIRVDYLPSHTDLHSDWRPICGDAEYRRKNATQLRIAS